MELEKEERNGTHTVKKPAPSREDPQTKHHKHKSAYQRTQLRPERVRFNQGGELRNRQKDNYLLLINEQRRNKRHILQIDFSL
ncbi:hypothetical protein KY285_022779 [Solanum tuberosum]|nr:hypothetical protein KY285_022779 [Solanum tuberosum]